MRTAVQIATNFLRLSQPELGEGITNLKLQKLLYYAQGFSLAINNKPLFKEDVLAWEHGPVVREVYGLYKGNASNALPIPHSIDELHKDEKDLIQDIWNVYGQFSGWRLREMTHNESPWKDTERNSVIPHSKMKAYFDTLVVTNGTQGD